MQVKQLFEFYSLQVAHVLSQGIHILPLANLPAGQGSIHELTSKFKLPVQVRQSELVEPSHVAQVVWHASHTLLEANFPSGQVAIQVETYKFKVPLHVKQEF